MKDDPLKGSIFEDGISNIEIRKRILELSYKTGMSHIGSSLSCVEILNTLYSITDIDLIKSEDDIKRIAESTKNVFMRLTATSSMNIVDTIKSVVSSNIYEFDDDIFLNTIYTHRDVHLMLMVHPKTEPVLNSMFDTVFKAEGDFNISELG